MRTVPLHEPRGLPVWLRPTTLLFLMAAAMPLAFATWSALLNNFVVEVAGFTGVEIGWLHTVREIPGFLAVGVIAVIMVVREQVLAMVSLAMLGVATAVTAFFASLAGILTVTILSSIGFHYYETVNQSLQPVGRRRNGRRSCWAGSPARFREARTCRNRLGGRARHCWSPPGTRSI